MIFRAKKSLGQNFLKSKEALRSIISAGEIGPEDTILEVGPGKGILTTELIRLAGKVIAIEKDRELITLLSEKFSKEIADKKLELIEADILEFDETELQRPYKLIANIPYYITGALIRKFLESNSQPERMVLMLQKEVAERIVTRDGKESLLSIAVKAYGTPKYIQKVAAKYFSPMPNVDSAIISITNISKKLFADISEKEFFDILHLGFAHKRKMLVGNLRDSVGNENLETIFSTIGIDQKSRAENVRTEQWFELAKIIVTSQQKG